MSKIAKQWETQLGRVIPYMAWGGLAAGNRCCWTTSRHSNTCYELHIILEGTCTLAFDELTHPMSPGQAVLIAPNVFHAPGAVSEPFCRFSVSVSAAPSLAGSLGAVDKAGCPLPGDNP